MTKMVDELSKIDQLVNQIPNWSIERENLLMEPYNYLANQSGKKFRNKLINILNNFYKLPEDVMKTLSHIIELLHNSSLLIDDIEDGSIMRRGVKVAHLIYGIPMTINSANYIYFISMQFIPNLIKNIEATTEDDDINLLKLVLQTDLYNIFNEEICNLHRGQGLDIYWRDNCIIPNEDDYFDMVMNKTGGLFRLMVRLMERLSIFYNSKKRLEKSLIPLCNLLGIIYQIRDDYLNLSSETMTLNKGFADDISEGKLSFPIIHGLNFEKTSLPKDKHFIFDTLLSRTQNEQEKLKVVNFLKDQSNSLNYAKDMVASLIKLIHDGGYLPQEPENKEVSIQLNGIVQYLSSL